MKTTAMRNPAFAWVGAKKGLFYVRTLAPLKVLSAFLGCATFNPFQADIGSMDVDGQVQKPAYLATVSYWGHVGAAVHPATNNHPYVYLWLPSAAPELGVRVVSPSLGAPEPSGGHDVVEAAWSTHSSERAFFDACAQVERCSTLWDANANGNGLNVPKSCQNWLMLGSNDDSPEVPKAPDGRMCNALVRIPSSNDDPQRVLGRGLYRIKITGCDKPAATGTFLLQVGSPLSLEGALLARSEAALWHLLGPHNSGAQPGLNGDSLGPSPRPYVPPLPDSLAPLAPTSR